MSFILDKELLGTIAIIVSFATYVPYIYGIYKGHVRPHAFSWLVWSILTGIAFVIQLQENAGPGAWATGITAAFSVAFIICGWRMSRVDIRRSDWIALFASLAIIPIWLGADQPVLAVLLIALIDAISFYPTFRKGFVKPWDDSIATNVISTCKWVFSIMALENYTIATAFYPISLIITTIIFGIMLYVRRQFVAKPR